MTSRITIILHPNESRIDVVLNDTRFNNERYYFSREAEPVGEELAMLEALENIIGIEKAETSKNTLSLEISAGMLESEFMPQVIRAVKKFGVVCNGEDYEPRLIVDNRRYAVCPESNDEGWTTVQGVRQLPNAVNIGLPYTTLQDFQAEE